MNNNIFRFTNPSYLRRQVRISRSSILADTAAIFHSFTILGEKKEPKLENFLLRTTYCIVIHFKS
jgi:hypothetical protein